MRLRSFQSRFRSRAAAIAMMALLCLAIGRVTEHAYVAASAAIAVLALGLIAPWLAVRLLSAAIRSASLRCRAGSDVDLTIELRNAWPLPIPAVEFVFPAETSLAIESPPVTLRPGRQLASARMTAKRRGVFDLGRLRLATSFPFGLWSGSRTVEGGGRLVVWPVAEAVPTVVLNRASRTVMADTVGSRMIAEGELAGVRSYRRGDAMRTIHWQQTARHDRLIVRERAGGERRGCVVWLDTRASSFDTAATFERAVSLAAGVVEKGLRDGLSVEMRIGPSCVIAGDEQGCAQALDALAAVTLTNEEMPVAGRHGADGLVITTRQGWGLLAKRHLHPLFADTDPTEGTRS